MQSWASNKALKPIRRNRRGFLLALVTITAASVVAIRVVLPASASEPVRGASDITAALAGKFARPDSIPFPPDNRLTEPRRLLGQTLFFDPRLSRASSVSCVSCHNPGMSWGDGNPRAIGHGTRPLDRRTPTILDLAWAQAMFWDGRAETLEEQALGPITSPAEMNLPMKTLLGRLRQIPGYRSLFAAAYPGDSISSTTIAKALATFERTVVSNSAPFDRWIAGDSAAISAEAKLGFELFTGKANCSTCHSGWRLTDDSFHDIGVPGTDRGRGKIIDVADAMFAFKTPTLRNVDRRAPYMHNGSERTLDDVIELYDRGGRIRRPSISSEIKPLKLTSAERRAIVVFLATLTSNDAPVTIPVLPR